MPISSASFDDRLNRIRTGRGRQDGGAAKARASRKLVRAGQRLFSAGITALAFAVVGKAGLIAVLGDGAYNGHVARLGDMVPGGAGTALSVVLEVDPLTGWMADTAGAFAREFV